MEGRPPAPEPGDGRAPAKQRRAAGGAGGAGGGAALLDALGGLELLPHALAFLRVPELVHLAPCNRRSCQASASPVLWRALGRRRRWGGLLAEGLAAAFADWASGDSASIDWKALYRRAVRAEAESVPLHVQRLRRRIPGVRGPLLQFVWVEDERWRGAALRALRDEPLLADDFASAGECLRQAKEEGHRGEDASVSEPIAEAGPEVERWRPSRKSFMGQLSVLALDSLRAEPALEARLYKLRARGGSCRPLVDCFECCADAPLPEQQLRAALRAALGAAAVCEGQEEAEQVALEERCDVYCCGGARMVEYCPHSFPSLLWRLWSGDKVIVSL